MQRNSTENSNWLERLASLPFFFHGFRTQHQVMDFASRFAVKPGMYFLRPSLSIPGQLTFTIIVDSDKIRHYPVCWGPKGEILCCNQSHSFNSFLSLVKYHKEHGFYHRDRGEAPVRLTQPVLHQTVKFASYDNVQVSDIGHRTDYLTPMEMEMCVTQAIKSFMHTKDIPGPLRKLNNLRVNGSNGCSICQTNVERVHRPHPSHSQTRCADDPRTTFKVPAMVHVSACNGWTIVAPQTKGTRHKYDEIVSVPKSDKKVTFFEVKTDSLGYIAPRPSTQNEVIGSDDSSRSTGYLCPCGMDIGEAQMPDGWTLHWSDIHQNMFFQNEKGETRWQLPTTVQGKLNDFQNGVINKYKGSLRLS